MEAAQSHPDPVVARHSAGMILDVAVGEWGLATASFDRRRQYRYWLSRIWDPLGGRLVWVLLNPSTADAFGVDPTLRRVAGFSRRWGFGAVEIVNLFALRATSPSRLLEADDPIGPLNDLVIEEAAASVDCVVVGWGNHGTIGDRAGSILALLGTAGRKVLALGVTKAGQPRHPLYVRGGLKPELFSEIV